MAIIFYNRTVLEEQLFDVHLEFEHHFEFSCLATMIFFVNIKKSIRVKRILGINVILEQKKRASNAGNYPLQEIIKKGQQLQHARK
jgi:hypothetical protein